MSTEIFYFSATGNSMKVARDLSEQLGGCGLTSMASVPSDTAVTPEAENVGLVFPVYAWGLPRMVSEFVDRLHVGKGRYVFAVATCVAIPGRTLRDLRRKLRQQGSDLDAGWVVKSGRSSLMRLNSLDRMIMKLDRVRFSLLSWEERTAEIVGKVRDHRRCAPETSNWSANMFGSFFHDMGLKAFKTADREFEVGDSCKGCGNCARICPRKNIEMVGGKPTFRHDCELCHACVQWCPRFAIRHKGFEEHPVQYRNPAIRSSEMLLR